MSGYNLGGLGGGRRREGIGWRGVSRRTLGRLGGRIKGPGRDLRGGGGSVDAAGRDSRRGSIDDSGRVCASAGRVVRVLDGRGSIDRSRRVRASIDCVVRLLDGILGCNGYKALLFLDRSRQEIQVKKTLVPGFAEGFLRKQESICLWAQAEQYLESILGVKAIEL
jgi:hypothetical protein